MIVLAVKALCLLGITQTAHSLNGSLSWSPLKAANELVYIHLPTPCMDEELVISIHSAVQNRARRNMLRNTWTNPSVIEANLQSKVKIIFILGWSNNSTLQKLVDYESEAYGDIVQSNFIDSYRNNTYKALSNLRWVSGPLGCPNAVFIIKTDDDAIIHLKRLQLLYGKWEEHLKHYGSNIMMGNVFGGGPDRNPKSTWYIPVETYPYATYPPWFQGLVYILTPRLASLMYPLSGNLTYMHADDVYISILADRVKPSITRITLNRYYAHAYESERNILAQWQDSDKIYFHCIKAPLFVQLWQLYCSEWKTC